MGEPLPDAALARWGFPRADDGEPRCEVFTGEGLRCTRRARYHDVIEHAWLCRQHAQRRARAEQEKARGSAPMMSQTASLTPPKPRP